MSQYLLVKPPEGGGITIVAASSSYQGAVNLTTAFRRAKVLAGWGKGDPFPPNWSEPFHLPE